LQSLIKSFSRPIQLHSWFRDQWISNVNLLNFNFKNLYEISFRNLSAEILKILGLWMQIFFTLDIIWNNHLFYRICWSIPRIEPFPKSFWDYEVIYLISNAILKQVLCLQHQRLPIIPHSKSCRIPGSFTPSIPKIRVN